MRLSFAASKVLDPPSGFVRDFFFYSVGWDKDADYHVAHARTVDPLPFHGMNDQSYGRQPYAPADAEWTTRYNTRWVGARVHRRSVR